MDAVLWHVEVSHYNEKARWALDYKRIPYRLRTPMPGLHRLAALRVTRGKHDRLPVLRLDDRVIGDSTAIIAALEQHQPLPPLYPDDAADRKRALALEEHFDEELAPRTRRLFWYYTLQDADAATDAALPGAGPVKRGVMRGVAPLAAVAVRRDYGINDAGAADALAGVRAAMDTLEQELDGREYLVGDRFSVADLTAAALFTPLISPPGRPFTPELGEELEPIRAELEARPGGEFVGRMYERHRGVPVAA